MAPVGDVVLLGWLGLVTVCVAWACSLALPHSVHGAL